MEYKEADRKIKISEGIFNRKLEEVITCQEERGCALRHSDTQAYFPVKSAKLKGIARANPAVLAANNEAEKLRNNIPTIRLGQHSQMENVLQRQFTSH